MILKHFFDYYFRLFRDWIGEFRDWKSIDESL